VLGYGAVLITLVAACRALTQRNAIALLCPGRAELDRIRLSARRALAQLLPKPDVDPPPSDATASAHR